MQLHARLPPSILKPRKGSLSHRLQGVRKRSLSDPRSFFLYDVRPRHRCSPLRVGWFTLFISLHASWMSVYNTHSRGPDWFMGESLHNLTLLNVFQRAIKAGWHNKVFFTKSGLVKECLDKYWIIYWDISTSSKAVHLHMKDRHHWWLKDFIWTLGKMKSVKRWGRLSSFCAQTMWAEGRTSPQNQQMALW